MNKNILFLNIVCGSIVIFTYFKYLGGAIQKKIPVDKLWSNIKGNYRNLYYISMIISTFSYLYLLYYFTFINKKNSKYIGLSMIVFFIGAILWAPFLYYHFIHNLDKIFVYLALCLTSIGIILIFIYTMSKGNTISKVCISLFLFHVLFLDNLIWSIKFNEI